MEKCKLFVFGTADLVKLGVLDDESEDVKCPACGWETTALYVVAKDRAEAEDMIKNGDAGMCGGCVAEMIANEGWDIVIGQ